MDTRDPIDEYAWQMIQDGAEHAIQDDLNEDEELDLTDDQWRDALKRARDLLWAIGLLAEEIGVAASMREYWEAAEDEAARRAVVLAAFGQPVPLDEPQTGGDVQP